MWATSREVAYGTELFQYDEVLLELTERRKEMLKMFYEAKGGKEKKKQTKCQGGYSFDNTDFFGVCSMIRNHKTTI